MRRRSFLGFLALTPAVPALARAGLRAIEGITDRWVISDGVGVPGVFTSLAFDGINWIAVGDSFSATSQDGLVWSARPWRA